MPIHTTALDHHGHVPLTIRCQDGAWHVTIDLTHITRKRLITHLHSMLRITSVDASGTPIPLQHEENTLQAEWSAPATDAYHLTLNGTPLLGWQCCDDTIEDTLPVLHRLTTLELRMLGQYPHTHLPYPRDGMEALASTAGITTDLHTHLSSQITAQGLLDAAAQADAAYPVELLELAGIDTTGLPIHTISSRRFTPAASDGLSCEQEGQDVAGIPVAELLKHPEKTQLLANAMSIPADAVFTFDALERQVYRMRNPLSKHPGAIAATIHAVAEDYARQGIHYAELAVTAALNPDWLATALPALRSAEETTGVSLRLLAALPRSLAPMDTLRQLSIVKFIARHPAIVGIDFLGYEANKTRNFGWALSNIARFAAAQSHGIDRMHTGWDFQDDFIIRVHAGENGKNPDNVAEVLALAETHNVRVRVGHAAYGDVSENLERAKRLAEKGLLIIEFNPDSNMAMNNIDRIEQLPIRDWAQAGVPFVIASDGAGVYRTDAQQLWMNGVLAGLTEDDLACLNRTEQAHIAHQQSLYQRKSAAFHALYENDDAFVNAMRTHIDQNRRHVADRLSHKTPILLAGASGSSWARIDANTQRAIHDGIHRLVKNLDPEKVYFALGRVKHEGIGRILDEALDAYYAADPDAPPFDVVGMLSQHQNMPTLADHINHIIPLSGELMSVPTRMTDLLKAHGGCALYIGGSAFTRDFIHCSEALGLPFGVMADAAGASAEKAQALADRYIFYGADGMVAQVQDMLK